MKQGIDSFIRRPAAGARMVRVPQDNISLVGVCPIGTIEAQGYRKVGVQAGVCLPLKGDPQRTGLSQTEQLLWRQLLLTLSQGKPPQFNAAIVADGQRLQPFIECPGAVQCDIGVRVNPKTGEVFASQITPIPAQKSNDVFVAIASPGSVGVPVHNSDCGDLLHRYQHGSDLLRQVRHIRMHYMGRRFPLIQIVEAGMSIHLVGDQVDRVRIGRLLVQHPGQFCPLGLESLVSFGCAAHLWKYV